MNKKIIRVLILEDNPIDAELIQFELEEANIDFIAKVVSTKNDFIHELQKFYPDVILSDYDLPQYNGALALTEAKRSCPDVPFILVTGATSDDRAVDILTGGAKDYIMKSRLNRLVPALFKALNEADEHRARKLAEQELRVANRDLKQQIAKKTEDLRQYSQRLEILSWIVGKLQESDNPHELIEELCHRIMKFLDCDAFFNYLIDDTSGRLHLNAYAGIPLELARTIEWLDYGTAMCGYVARDKFRIVAENIPEKPDTQTELVKYFSIKAYACYPLIQHNRVIGTLSFATCSRTTFSEEDLAMMKAIVDQISIAIERINTEKVLRMALAKAEENEYILNALMENVLEGVTIAESPDVKIKMISRYGQEILGNSYNGMTLKEIIDEWSIYDKDGKTPIKVEDLPLSLSITKGETVVGKEIILVNAKGQSFLFLCNAAPIRDSSGKIVSGIVAWRDISKLKRSEKRWK